MSADITANNNAEMSLSRIPLKTFMQEAAGSRKGFARAELITSPPAPEVSRAHAAPSGLHNRRCGYCFGGSFGGGFGPSTGGSDLM